MIGQPIQLHNYQSVVAKLQIIREKTGVEKAASGALSKLGKAFNGVSEKMGLKKYVILKSEEGNESIKVSLNEMKQLLGQTTATISKQLHTHEGITNITYRLDHTPDIPPPPWNEIRQKLEAANPNNLKTIKKEEMLQTLNTLEAHWDEIGKYGQWDEQSQVLHLRKGPEKNSDRTWSLPRSVEIHNTKEGVQIYALHKGKTMVGGKLERTPKLGTGGFKEVARSVNLCNLKNYVHATIDIGKRAKDYELSEEEVRKFSKTEIEIQQLFNKDEEFVQIAGWNEYTDKDGSPKIALTLEQCNSGELFDAAMDHTTQEGQILDKNIGEAMQVITDLIQMLVKLKREKIINRDIKPENIFLNVDENRHVRAKMSDFGLAMTHESAVEMLKKQEQPGGSPDYVPPEVVNLDLSPEERSSYATHTWQMGLVLHCLLASYLPLWGKDQDGGDLHPFYTPKLLDQATIIMKIEKGTFNPEKNKELLSCVVNSPEHFQFLRRMVIDMLQIDPSMRPSAEELLQRLEDFKQSVQTKKSSL